jgi:hypothetical protein
MASRVGLEWMVALHELLCFLFLELVAGFMNDCLHQVPYPWDPNFSCNEAVSRGSAWWNLVCSAETNNLVKWWFGGKSSDALLDKEGWTVVIFLPLWEGLPNRWMDVMFWEKLWMQPRVVPAIPSFHMNEKSVVPSSHSKLEPGQDLVWTEWLLACWTWDVYSWWWIFCGMHWLISCSTW